MFLKPDDEQRLSSLYADHNYATALDILLALKSLYGEGFFKAAYYRHLALCHSKVGQYEEADACIAICDRENPSNLSIKTLEVESFIQRGDLERAGVTLASLLDNFQIDGNNTRFFYPFILASKIFKITGDYEVAKKMLRKAKSIASNNGYLANHSLDFIDRALSAQTIDRTAGLIDHATLLRSMKQGAIRTDGKTLAIYFLDKRIEQEKRPDHLKVCHTYAALCHFDLNNLSMAKSHIDSALAIDEYDPHANGAMVLYHLANHDVANAKEHFSASAISILNDRKISFSLVRHFREANDGETADKINRLLAERKHRNSHPAPFIE